MRASIQLKIIEAIESGEFPVVTYEGNKPTKGANYSDTPLVWVNETQATLDGSSKSGAMSGAFNLGPWLFQAKVKFSKEVEISNFIKNKLSMFSFSEGEYLVTVKAGGYVVDHPVTSGASTGTQAVINLTATTRR